MLYSDHWSGQLRVNMTMTTLLLLVMVAHCIAMPMPTDKTDKRLQAEVNMKA